MNRCVPWAQTEPLRYPVEKSHLSAGGCVNDLLGSPHSVSTFLSALIPTVAVIIAGPVGALCRHPDIQRCVHGARPGLAYADNRRPGHGVQEREEEERN